jgi:8-oxo-dGTP diphosphatase
VWQTDDRLRPLLKPGQVQAGKLVPLLAAYDVSLIASSTSARCVATVMPYAAASGWPLNTFEELSEEGATALSVTALVDDLMAGDDPAVVCSHRPVLPAVFDSIGVADPGLEPGAMLVVHHRRGRVLSTELHPPT